MNSKCLKNPADMLHLLKQMECTMKTHYFNQGRGRKEFKEILKAHRAA